MNMGLPIEELFHRHLIVLPIDDVNFNFFLSDDLYKSPSVKKYFFVFTLLKNKLNLIIQTDYNIFWRKAPPPTPLGLKNLGKISSIAKILFIKLEKLARNEKIEIGIRPNYGTKFKFGEQEEIQEISEETKQFR